MKKSILIKLFNSLILPIVAYGCQAWLPFTFFARSLRDKGRVCLSDISKDPLEKLHLSFLKWILGVKRPTPNPAVWGDTGCYPLAIVLTKQVFDYMKRLKTMEVDGINSLVMFAYKEQQELSLNWWSNLRQIQSKSESLVVKEPSDCPSRIQKNLKLHFIDQWNAVRKDQSKLSFYNSIKESFCQEDYLDLNISHDESKRLAQTRMSAHQFNIETGRYGFKRANRLYRRCETCSTKDLDILNGLNELPFFDLIVEDEWHVLRTCPLYEDLRSVLSGEAKCALFNDMGSFLSSMANETGRYLVKVWKRRFPDRFKKDNRGH